MFKRIRAYILGMKEFRSDFTTYFDVTLIDAYDAGRDLAHAITLRRYDR